MPNALSLPFSLGILAVMVLSLAAQGFAFRRSMKKTVYTYRNIGLIGGILFTGVLLVFHGQFCLQLIKDPDIGPETVFWQLLGFPMAFSYYAVFVMILVSLLLGISNVALIRHEGFRLHNALALLIAVLYVGGTVVVYGIMDRLTMDVLGKNPLLVVFGTVFPLFLLLMLCYFECIFAGSAVLGWIAAKRVPKYDKDFIIILGCSIDKRGGLLPLLKGRVNRAVRFAWDQERATGKPLKYVPSGGQGPGEIMSEGSAMELYLLTHGAEEDEVFPEKKSRNTLENFRESLKIIRTMVPNPKVAFATTNYHILRSGILARKAGIDAEGIAGDTKWYFWPNGFIREFFGILSLERKAHVITALVLLVLCLLIGSAEYLLMAGI